MATFVLVPGAWHGGWCYRDVTRGLRAGGHDVHPLTLTGLGDRRHLATREVNLDTHVQDVVAAVTAEEIEDAVLVGHSYGGMVITGAAEQLAGRFRAIVYLDAFVPESGRSLANSAPPERHQQRVRIAREQGDGWRIPSPDPGFWGIDDPGHGGLAEKTALRSSPGDVRTGPRPYQPVGADRQTRLHRRDRERGRPVHGNCRETAKRAVVGGS